MSKHHTAQEEFWAGGFGLDYIDRNNVTPENEAISLAMWNRIVPSFSRTPESALEIGSNIGLNLRALKKIFPNLDLSAVEINDQAATILKQWGQAEVHQESILTFKASRKYDLVFTSGVLIHIDPESLPLVYEKMYDGSQRYIVVSEYYNPMPVEVSYRGHSGKLFKRDFAGEMMALYPDLVLRGYGFVYHRDPHFAFDDLNWFVLEKNQVPKS